MSRALHSFVLLFLPVLVLAACRKSKETCERESADLATMFASMDTRRGIETRFVKLVRRDELPISADELGAVLEVTADGVRVWGASETPQRPSSALATMLSRWYSDQKPQLLLAIDAATPWKTVVELFEAIQAKGFREVSLVFARKPVEMTPPPKSSIDAQLDVAEKAEPSERATEVAKIASEVVKDCEAVTELFSSVGGSEDKAKAMIGGLPPALVECNCKCDVGALKSLFFRLLANRAPTTTIHVRLDGKEVAFPESALWSEASARLIEGQAFKAVTQQH